MLAVVRVEGTDKSSIVLFGGVMERVSSRVSEVKFTSILPTAIPHGGLLDVHPIVKIGLAQAGRTPR